MLVQFHDEYSVNGVRSRYPLPEGIQGLANANNRLIADLDETVHIMRSAAREEGVDLQVVNNTVMALRRLPNGGEQSWPLLEFKQV